jgi:hypothetical protein
MYWTKERLKEFAADDYSVVTKKYKISYAHAVQIASMHNFPRLKITANHGGWREGSGRKKE